MNGMPSGKSVNNSTIEEVMMMAELIVKDGDVNGPSARHPTTILLRQILERLTDEIKNKINDEFVANRE